MSDFGVRLGRYLNDHPGTAAALYFGLGLICGVAWAGLR